MQPTIIPEQKLNVAITDLHTMLEDASQSVSISYLLKGLDELRSNIANPVATIRLICLSTPTADSWGKFHTWINSETSNNFEEGKRETINSDPFFLELETVLFEKVQTSQAGKVKPVMLISFLSEQDMALEDWKEKITALATDTPCFLLISEKEISDRVFLQSLASLTTKFYCKTLGDPSLLSSLKEFLLSPDQLLPMNFAFNQNVLSAMESINTVLTLNIQQEERNLKAKKAVNQQQVIKVQTRTNNSSEVFNQFKTVLSNYFSQIERGLSDNLENLNRQKTGEFSKSMEELIEHIDQLQRVKGGKNDILKIESEVEHAFFNSIFQYLRKQGQNNLLIMHDSFKGLETEVNKLCEKNNLPSISLSLKFLTDQQLNLILENTVRWDRPYEGSAPRKGAYEYFMAMRKYQMIIAMIASSFGLSFMRGLSMYTIPVTILLLGFGGVNVYKTVEKEREENDLKELTKAKEVLRGELKRIASEFSRQWMKVLQDHLRQQNNIVSLNVDSVLKDYTGKKAVDEEEEKKRVQRMVQSIDNQERKITGIVRASDTFTRNIQRLSSDLKHAFVQQSRQKA